MGKRKSQSRKPIVCLINQYPAIHTKSFHARLPQSSPSYAPSHLCLALALCNSFHNSHLAILGHRVLSLQPASYLYHTSTQLTPAQKTLPCEFSSTNIKCLSAQSTPLIMQQLPSLVVSSMLQNIKLRKERLRNRASCNSPPCCAGCLNPRSVDQNLSLYRQIPPVPDPSHGRLLPILLSSGLEVILSFYDIFVYTLTLL